MLITPALQSGDKNSLLQHAFERAQTPYLGNGTTLPPTAKYHNRPQRHNPIISHLYPLNVPHRFTFSIRRAQGSRPYRNRTQFLLSLAVRHAQGIHIL